MELHAKLVRSQLNFFKPLAENCSLELTRKGQDKLGELMTAMHRRETFSREHDFRNFQGAWIMPKDERRTGVILYLHGGGYTCGSLEYAKGFASTLATECGVRVFCAAYRLAPEHPYPAALEDAMESYEYLLKKGYPARQILLCGESAGGGLIYALCLKLKELGRPLPCGLVGISPWTDLTSSGASFETNRDVDPSMTRELLTFYAGCYTQTPEDPLCSPLFGDLHGLPPSLLFVGGDEVMLDDTRMLHEKLLKSGCRSKMHIAPERWHAYVLYCLTENMEEDFQSINHFLDKVLSPARSLRWMRLDNAAKIYPAAKRRNWNNFFRLSATLTEPVDVAVLRSALDVTVRRFPSMAVRLRRGVFWYYLEQIPQAPAIQSEKSCPLAHVPFDQVRRCALRVLVYHDRIAVEFFHAITDGTGGTIFLKTLLAEYLCQKYGITIPAENGVLGRLEEPDEEELEDSFLRYAGDVKASRKEATAYHLSGTPEPDGFKNLVTLMVPTEALRSCAKECGVTEFRLLHHPGDRSPYGRLHLPGNLRRRSPPDGTGEQPPHHAGQVCRQCGQRALPRAAGDAAVCEESGHEAGVRRSGGAEVLSVPVQSGQCPFAGGHGPLCAPDGFHHRRAGGGPPRLRRGVVERHRLYQLHPQHPGAGAGAALLSGAARAGPAGEGGEQPALREERSAKPCIVSNAAWSWRTASGCVPCAAPVCSTRIFPAPLPTRPIPRMSGSTRRR